MKAMTIQERFQKWVKPDQSGCHVWTASCTRDGYGKIMIARKEKKAHRVAYEQVHGPIPEGFSVLHRCDNPPCVNPAHLFLGTQLDNVRDMHSKGRDRKARGESQHCAVLTADQIREIRNRCAAGELQKDLAPEFGVGRGQIGYIVRRESWRHVT